MADSNYVYDLFESFYTAEFDRKYKNDASDSFLLAVSTVLGTVGLFWLRLIPHDSGFAALINLIGSVGLGAAFITIVSTRPSRLALLLVLSILPGMIWYALTREGAALDYAEMAFLALCGTFGGIFALAVVCLVGSVLPRHVTYLAYPEEFANYMHNLHAFYGFDATDEESERKAVENELRRLAQGQFIESSQQLRRTNLNKVKWQSRCKYFLAFSVFLVLLNALPMYFVQRKLQNTQSVKVLEMPPIQLQ